MRKRFHELDRVLSIRILFLFLSHFHLDHVIACILFQFSFSQKLTLSVQGYGKST